MCQKLFLFQKFGDDAKNESPYDYGERNPENHERRIPHAKRCAENVCEANNWKHEDVFGRGTIELA